MARPTEGFKLVPKPSGIFHVRWTIKGQPRHQESTGERDRGTAEGLAAQAYANALIGRKRPILAPAVVYTGKSLMTDLFAEWIEARTGVHKPSTIKWNMTTAGAHLCPFFERLHDVTADKMVEYALMRAKCVKRHTIRRELSCLGSMITWAAEEKKYLRKEDIPRRPDLKEKRFAGVRSPKCKQRIAKVPIGPEEAHRIIRQLPVTATRASFGDKGRRMLIRDFFVVLWETALRPETVAAIAYPEHWDGDLTLRITETIDKCQYARVLTLTEAARDALKRAWNGKPGVMMPGTLATRWRYFKRAAVAAKVPRGREASCYDFRHGRATEMLETTGNVLGVAFNLGHLDAGTTTRTYATPHERAGRNVMGAMPPSPSFEASSGAATVIPIRKSRKNKSQAA